MRRFFDEDTREPSRRKGESDTELTLGSGVLLAVFFGLILLCGLCFGLGYAVGSHGSKGPVFQSQTPAAGPSPQLAANSEQAKPSATALPSAAPQQPTIAGQQAVGAPGMIPGQPAAAQVQTTTAAVELGASPAAPQVVTPNNSGWHPVQPALPGGTAGTESAQPVSANEVRPAMPGQGTVMVQIAALSSQEDADVLIGALRRHGYAVSAVRYPADRLIHVCIGPFSNRMDANSMKQKLQSDGYNAEVMQ